MKQSEFLKTVMPFKDKVFRLAKRLLVSTEEAEDATQELYFKLWKNKSKLEGYKSIEAFAMTMTTRIHALQILLGIKLTFITILSLEVVLSGTKARLR